MLTRREFVAQLAAASAAVAALPARIGAGAGAGGARTPVVPTHAVVSIHLDQPYIDVTGRATPYLPPAGLRGGAAVAHLSETDFRRDFVYV